MGSLPNAETHRGTHLPRFLRSRQHLTVGLDGTVEMWAEDAQYLIPAGWTKLAEWLTDEDASAERSEPQPVQTVPQPGSMEWFEAHKKKG